MKDLSILVPSIMRRVQVMNAAAPVQVVLCSEDGEPIGMADRMEAHTAPGMLHQAFSVFVFRSQGRELLIQQRSADKPLFAARWANTCCSHPRRPAQDLAEVAAERLHEEFGFRVPLQIAGSFVYIAEEADHGVEHEHDTVLTGHATSEIEPRPNPNEIIDWKWIETSELMADMQRRPETYAPWLKPALEIAVRSF